MDLSLCFGVLWRFRLIVAAGFVLASFAKVGFAHGSLSISHRLQEAWQGTTRLFVTQQGFPWGRTVLPADSPTAVPPTSTSSGLQFADQLAWLG
jgi:hypothetical protein